MNKIRFILALVGLVGLVSPRAWAATYEFANRNADVNYLDVKYWKVGGATPATLPGSDDILYVTSGTGYNTKVSVTNDVREAYRYVVFKAQSSSSFLFDCFDHTYAITGLVSRAANQTVGCYLQTGAGASAFQVDTISASEPVLEWTKPQFTFASAADGCPTVTFHRGDYNFYDPVDGVAYSDHRCYMPNMGVAIFESGTTVRMPKLELGAVRALVRFDDCEAKVFGKVTMSNGSLEAHDGAKVTLSGSLTLGNGHLDVLGESVFTMSSDVSIGAASKPILTVSNSTFKATDFALGGSTDGEIRVEDGATFTLTGANALQIGASGGNGTLRVSGGEAKMGRIRISRSSAGAGNSARVIQTGGTLNLSGAVEFQQSCTDNNKGTHYLQLDGGITKASSVFRASTVTAGTVILSGDGGTLQPTDTASSYIYNLTRGEFGPKGLTLDTNEKNVGVKLAGTNKEGEEGLFVKDGKGTMTLTTTSWDVTRTVVRKGALKLAADTTLETALSVTDGATLSLAGAATDLTVSSLALTNCVLALDPGDVITVTGAFDLQDVKINWTSLPEDEQSFLVVSGELSEAQKRAIRRLYYENALAAGKHAESTVEYDEQSGTTTVKTKVAGDTPLTETAVWTGSGAWATAENWQDSVKPTEMKKAVFGADAAGTEVEIAAGDFAGALSFTGGNYRLFGETLAIEGYPGAAEIDVEAGSQTIDAPMELNASTPIKLASGVELSLNGRIGYGGLDKFGRGHLTLGGTLALGGQGFISRDGLVTVTNATALGTTSADVAKFAAGTLEFAHPDGEPMTINAAVSGAAEETGKTTLVFKVESDATLKNFANTNNRLLKRGAGVLTLDFDEARTITGLMSADLDTTSNIGCTYPADGSEPSGYRFPFGIAEGELKLVGRGEAPVTVTSRAKTLVGLPTEEAESSAAILTLDNVKFVSSDYSFYIGYQTGSATYKNRKAIVRILNGSTLQVSAGVVVGYSSSYAAGRCQVMMTNGTYRIVAADGSLSRGGLASGQTANVEYLMNKSSFIVKTSIVTDGSTYMDADNGSYFGGENRTPMVLKYNNQNHARIYGELFFHNGSTLALSEIVETKDPNGKRKRDLVFAFDDAEWIYDAACGDKVWPVAEEGHNKYEMRGRGVILKPAAGNTFETLEPFTGEGGVVNAGEGTVKFGEDAYQCAGTLEITEPAGTIDVSADDGTSHTVIPVKGQGTLKGAKATRIVIKADAADDWTGISTPTLEDCTAGTVVIDMGRTAENPMSGTFPQNVAVAKWTGAGALPRFRLSNTGIRNVGADFTVDPDGTVRMTPHEVGIILIVR